MFSQRINNIENLGGVVWVIRVRWNVVFRIIWGVGVKVFDSLTFAVFRVVDGRGIIFKGDFITGGKVAKIFVDLDVVDPLE